MTKITQQCFQGKQQIWLVTNNLIIPYWLSTHSLYPCKLFKL